MVISPKIIQVGPTLSVCILMANPPIRVRPKKQDVPPKNSVAIIVAKAILFVIKTQMNVVAKN